MLHRLKAQLDLFRPRSLAALHRQDAELRAELSAVSHAVDAAATTAGLGVIQRGVDQQARDTRAVLEAIARRLDAIDLRQRQLLAVARANTEEAETLAGLTFDTARVLEHVRSRVVEAPLAWEPFPHLIIDNLLPDDLYRLLLETIPPGELFADRPENKQQLPVPFELASTLSRRVWQFLADTVIDDAIQPTVLAALHEPLHAWLRDSFSVPDVSQVRMRSTDGRLLRRTRGYVIRPHRDPQRGMITCLFYLAKPSDAPSWGTQFYTVAGDRPATTADPNWIPEAQCQLVKDVPFVANRLLVWLNSVGAHGAAIPADAPEGLVRYAYQFKLGPTGKALDALVAQLPPDRQAAWHRGKSY